MKKAIIFDLDGTLLDTLTDIMESVNKVLEKHHFPTHDLDAYKYFIGSGIGVLTQKAFPQDISQADFELYLGEVMTEYESRQTLKTKPYPGIVAMLEKLNDMGIKISILSNKPDEFAKPTVAHFFPNIKFEVVFGSRKNVNRKPAPDAVFEILEILNLEKSECFFVGDTSTDIRTGVNAGLETIGVKWGFRTEEELRNAGATHIIDTSNEIFQLLES
ncbi:MAG: HAD family hydrolase [Bacteroidetes bacterium]|nr:MAG: HAD family hydrolase [Bacteroidota bacterium]